MVVRCGVCQYLGSGWGGSIANGRREEGGSGEEKAEWARVIITATGSRSKRAMGAWNLDRVVARTLPGVLRDARHQPGRGSG